LNPTKFSKEIAKEQLKFPDKCLYHLSKSHLIDDCHVKKECARLCSANFSSSNASSSVVSQLRHLTEETIEKIVDADDNDDCVDSIYNDTNEADLLYFVHVSNHYLCLVRNSMLSSSLRHPMKFLIIADSGASYHMFKEKDFFESITPTTGSVFLGDGKTSLNMRGVGTVKCKVGNNILTLDNVRYIPDLGESIYSLFLHIQRPGHSLNSSFTDGLLINFPTFTTKAIVGTSDIYLDAVPLLCSSDAMVNSSTITPSSLHTCRNITDISDSSQTLQNDSANTDHLISDLCQYYNSVKVKRQLGFDVPAGFQQSSNHQQMFQLYTPPRKSEGSGNIEKSCEDISFSLLSELKDTPIHSNKSSECHITSTSDTHIINDNECTGNPCCASSNTRIIHSVDKQLLSISKIVQVNEDFLRACVGFCRVDTLKKYLNILHQPTLRLDNTPADAILDPGFYASL
jgi:hypothetical protein